MLIWTNTWYQMSRGRPMQNEEDGLPDIRCPACGYRMVGLREARCPECGRNYTLDELLAKQGFSRVPAGSVNGEPVETASQPTA
jgi:DNA-directed RNA polymerase subunit RPC12/RpoP